MDVAPPIPSAALQSPLRPSWLRRLGGLWRHGDFLKLWTGQSISVFGSMVGGTALDFTAVMLGLIRTKERSGRAGSHGLQPQHEADTPLAAGGQLHGVEERTSVWRDALDGLRVVWRHPILRALLVAVVLTDLAGGIVGTLMLRLGSWPGPQ